MGSIIAIVLFLITSFILFKFFHLFINYSLPLVFILLSIIFSGTADFTNKILSIMKLRGSNAQLVTLLFLAVNPKDKDKLRLDEEIKKIKKALRQTQHNGKFQIEQEWAVQNDELQDYFLRYKPDIVHFSGHGSTNNQIILEDEDGFSNPVSIDALSNLFKLFKNKIRCVVLNSCYSKDQAQAIAQHIDCVIGMSKAIGDDAAIRFSIAFYRALGYGKSIKAAFDLGRNEIDLNDLNEQDTPQLFAIRKEPEEVILLI